MAKNNWEHIQRSKGHKSGLETTINEQLHNKGIDGQYESEEIPYVIPETKHTYKPDFKLPNGIYIESKGWWLPEDRKKHLLIRDQHPDKDIRFVFQNPNGKIYKGSTTTYADWCTKNGFKWAKKEVPQEWIDEVPVKRFF